MKRAGKSLTIKEIEALRADWRGDISTPEAKGPERPLKRKADVLSPGGMGEQRSKPAPKKVKLDVSLTDSSKERVNTVSVVLGRKPFTVLLWNIESFGEHKSLGNPFANRIIRYVLDELAVDVAIFLETKCFPSDTVLGLERNLSETMHTAKEKTTAPRTDITERKNLKEREMMEIELEEDQRRKVLELTSMKEDEVKTALEEMSEEERASITARLEELGYEKTFHAITSSVTGKQQTIPEKIGPFRTWPRGTDRTEKEGDISRFKKAYSTMSSQLVPWWLLYHYNDLCDIYDLRFVDELPENEDEYPDYDDEGRLTRPATREEVARLRRCVMNICKNMQGRDPGEKEARNLLRNLERCAVLTLKPFVGTFQRKVAKRPPRDVIGRKNEGNSCYLNAVLQLLARIPREQYASENPSQPDLVKQVDLLLRTAAKEASDGTYDSRETAHAKRQTKTERNYVSVLKTKSLRCELKKICGWQSIDRPEDADEALRTILNAYAPAKLPGNGEIGEAWGDERKLEEIRSSGLHFFVELRNLLNHDKREAHGSDLTDAVVQDQKLWLVSYDTLNILPLLVPKGKEKTFEQACKEFQSPAVPSSRVKFKHADGIWEASVDEQQLHLSELPDHLLVSLQRIRVDETGKDRTKISDPVEMPFKIDDRVLLGFIRHWGKAPDGGHYTAYIRTGERWYHVDDGIVEPLTKEKVKGALPHACICYYGPEPQEQSFAVRAEEDEVSEKEEIPEVLEEMPEEHLDDIGTHCPLLDSIFEYEPQEDDGIPSLNLPEPREISEERLDELQELLSEMIGTRRVETYTVLFRSSDAGTVHTPVMASRHRNVGHYVFKHDLLSADEQGRELGYQNPLTMLNGRCPFFFELDVWRNGSQEPVRLPFVSLHAPYGLPQAFRDNPPKKQGKREPKDSDELPPKAKLMDFDTDEKALRMRADAMCNLLRLGIPSYDPSKPAGALASFQNAIIAGDFNLDMCKRKSKEVIDDAYGTLEQADFAPSVEAVPTTLHAVETMLPVRKDEKASLEQKWYGSAYDNIFVRGEEVGIAVTKSGQAVSGVVDVLEVITRHADDKLLGDKSLFETAKDVICDESNYHKATYTARRRAEHEKKRWENAASDRRAQAYMLYRRYVSDHLPVFVDLDLGGRGKVVPVKPEEKTNGTRTPRPVIGIQNMDTSCYLNAVLQLLAVRTESPWWAEEDVDAPDLSEEVKSFLAAMVKEAKEATYEGDAQAFSGPNCKRRSHTRQMPREVRIKMRAYRSHAFGDGRQEDAADALDAILTGCARKHSEGNNGKAINLSSEELRKAYEKNELDKHRPSPVHCFVQVSKTYKIQDSPIQDTADIRLDEHGQAQFIDCVSLLRFVVNEKTTTLQESWMATKDNNDDPAESKVMFQNECYKATVVREKTELLERPDYLIVQLKRFLVEEKIDTETEQKRFVPRKVKQDVDASKGFEIGDAKYEVVAFISHKGDVPTIGHYIAFVQKDHHWYEIDDSTVTYEPKRLSEAMKQGYIYLLRKVK